MLETKINGNMSFLSIHADFKTSTFSRFGVHSGMIRDIAPFRTRTHP
jgi:hypothetical protein